MGGEGVGKTRPPRLWLPRSRSLSSLPIHQLTRPAGVPPAAPPGDVASASSFSRNRRMWPGSARVTRTAVWGGGRRGQRGRRCTGGEGGAVSGGARRRIGRAHSRAAVLPHSLSRPPPPPPLPLTLQHGHCVTLACARHVARHDVCRTWPHALTQDQSSAPSASRAPRQMGQRRVMGAEVE